MNPGFQTMHSELDVAPERVTIDHRAGQGTRGHAHPPDTLSS